MDISTWIKSFIDLSFPVAVTVYLLVDVSRKMERIRRQMVQLTLGLGLILQELDSLPKYKTIIDEYTKREKDKGKDDDDTPPF